MDQKALQLSETGGGPKCTHHWVIGFPDGPVSRGVCRLCGEERVFKNHLDVDWFDYIFPGELLPQERFSGGVLPEPPTPSEDE